MAFAELFALVAGAAALLASVKARQLQPAKAKAPAPRR